MTTVVAFTSLIVSDLRPVIDFGVIMAIGITIAFAVTFTLLPSGLVLCRPGEVADGRDLTHRVTEYCAALIEARPVGVLVAWAGLVAAGLAGLSMLSVLIHSCCERS